MKPFDLELAKQGHPVCTRDGKDVRIICFDAKGPNPIIGLLFNLSLNMEKSWQFSLDGKHTESNFYSIIDNDLFMKPVMKTEKISFL